jgi:tetratricopeptide (TPR) repeat protein
MPDPASRYLAQAQSFKEAGDYKSARSSLESAISHNPDLFEARVNLADACMVLGDDKNAICHLLYALNLRPDFFAGHDSLGKLFEKAGDLERAAAHFRIAISLSPNHAEALNSLGRLLQKKGDYKNAVITLKKAIACGKPDFYEAYYNLGNCLRDIGQFDEAVACFKMASNRTPMFAEALSNLGEALMITGRTHDALACFKTVVDALPSCAPAFSNYLLTLNYLPECDSKQLFEQHLRFGAEFERLPATRPAQSNGRPPRSAARKLRACMFPRIFATIPFPALSSRYLQIIIKTGLKRFPSAARPPLTKKPGGSNRCRTNGSKRTP